MSRDPKSAQLPTDETVRTADATSAASGDAAGLAPRRKYTAPRLKRLGSVRDLTLGSPPGKAADGAAARRTPM